MWQAVRPGGLAFVDVVRGLGLGCCGMYGYMGPVVAGPRDIVVDVCAAGVCPLRSPPSVTLTYYPLLSATEPLYYTLGRPPTAPSQAWHW